MHYHWAPTRCSHTSGSLIPGANRALPRGKSATQRPAERRQAREGTNFPRTTAAWPHIKATASTCYTRKQQVPGGRRSGGCCRCTCTRKRRHVHACLYTVGLCVLVCETVPMFVAVLEYTDNNNALANRLSPGGAEQRSIGIGDGDIYSSGNRYPHFFLVFLLY